LLYSYRNLKFYMLHGVNVAIQISIHFLFRCGDPNYNPSTKLLLKFPISPNLLNNQLMPLAKRNSTMERVGLLKITIPGSYN